MLQPSMHLRREFQSQPVPWGQPWACLGRSERGHSPMSLGLDPSKNVMPATAWQVQAMPRHFRGAGVATSDAEFLGRGGSWGFKTGPVATVGTPKMGFDICTKKGKQEHRRGKRPDFRVPDGCSAAVTARRRLLLARTRDSIINPSEWQRFGAAM